MHIFNYYFSISNLVGISFYVYGGYVHVTLHYPKTVEVVPYRIFSTKFKLNRDTSRFPKIFENEYSPMPSSKKELYFECYSIVRKLKQTDSDDLYITQSRADQYDMLAIIKLDKFMSSEREIMEKLYELLTLERI